jgi:hypothetical protein
MTFEHNGTRARTGIGRSLTHSRAENDERTTRISSDQRGSCFESVCGERDSAGDVAPRSVNVALRNVLALHRTRREDNAPTRIGGLGIRRGQATPVHRIRRQWCGLHGSFRWPSQLRVVSASPAGRNLRSLLARPGQRSQFPRLF